MRGRPIYFYAFRNARPEGSSAMAPRNRRLGFVVLLIALVAVLFIVNRRQRQVEEPADLVLMNGKIVTVDDRVPAAAWIAVRGDRIAALGSEPKGFNRFVGDGTEIVDLGGALTIPGIIESHGHFTGLGQAKTGPRPDQGPVLGRHRRPGRRAPPPRPSPATGSSAAAGTRRSGTARPSRTSTACPSTTPLEQSLARRTPSSSPTPAATRPSPTPRPWRCRSITGATPNPDGGEIVKRRAAASPSALFRETASRPRPLRGRALRAEDDAAELEAEARKVDRARRPASASSKGITTLPRRRRGRSRTVDLYKRDRRGGRSGGAALRHAAARATPGLARARRRLPDGRRRPRNHLTVRTIKRLIDGALGARGAWLLEPYADLPASDRPEHGRRSRRCKETARARRRRTASSSAIHAIGDRAQPRDARPLRGGLQGPSRQDGPALARSSTPSTSHPADIPRFAALGVIAGHAGHPLHVGRALRPGAPRRRSGPRRAPTSGSKLMKTGAVISNGTDAPVEDVDPMRQLLRDGDPAS
ncbi:MAG: amidohydrolase family protein [Marinilabiliales bacterium]|nr:amidohydrolase family protein [Marinilabiliales bacterium]